jgi:regulator of replication initiation timing
MEEEVKRYLLGLIPGKTAMLRERHKRCSEKYPSFWETFPERFARMFEEEPEKTLERFLNLGDDECAWEKGDFRTRSILLDNFIGREIARELRRELEGMEDFEAEKPGAELQRLLDENMELRGRLRRLAEDYSKLKARTENITAEEEELRRRCKALEERLKECLRKREPKKLARMAGIIRLALRERNITPSYASKELGIGRRMLHDYLAELVEIGMLKKVVKGYYKIGEINKETQDLEGEIARRLAEKPLGKPRNKGDKRR